MIKRLTIRGNGWLLSIPKTIIKLLDINPEADSVDLEIEDTILIIKKHG